MFISPTAALDNRKVLEQNGIITTTPQQTECGDSDSNDYKIHMDILLSFFDKGVVNVVGHPSQRDLPPVVNEVDPIKQKGLNNLTNQSTCEKKIHAHPLPDDFLPSQMHKQKCLEKELDINSILEKFKIIYRNKKSQNWNLKFELFIAREWKSFPKINSNGKIENKNTIKFWEPGNPDYDRFHKPKEQQ